MGQLLRGYIILKPILGILLGEASGVGPEIVAKLCAEGKLLTYCRPLLIGDMRVLKMGQKTAGVEIPVYSVEDVSKAEWEGRIPMVDLKNLDPQKIKIGEISIDSGHATGDMLIAALRLCEQGEISGIVYAPLSKAALKLGGHNFTDELKLMKHYLSFDGPCGEMNIVDKLWTSRVTGHVPIKDISANLNIDSILKAVRLAYNALTRSGISCPRIAVAALNPHSGEDGLCGREEIEIIGPAVKMAREEGIEVFGPFPSDTVFISAFDGKYDAVVTMYHDQGQIAMKLRSYQTGVTALVGLPYPVTTTLHGAAFDIAGKGIARSDSMEQAVMIAAKMAQWGNIQRK